MVMCVTQSQELLWGCYIIATMNTLLFDLPLYHFPVSSLWSFVCNVTYLATYTVLTPALMHLRLCNFILAIWHHKNGLLSTDWYNGEANFTRKNLSAYIKLDRVTS